MPLTQTRWPIFSALVAGVSIVVLLWYFVLDNPKGEAVPASGGRYVEGVTRAPERINPLFAGSNSTDRDLASLIFSGLVRLSPEGTPLPDLAERWEVTGNGQSYVFYLRRGVAWQDSDLTRFDADDVVFTYGAIADPGFKGDPALAQLMQGVIVTARDPYTVEFRLEQAYAPFMAYLTVGILPSHLLEGLDANQLFNAEFNARPIGTGPYRFVRRTNEAVTLASNSTYYLGPPRISELEFKLFADRDDLVAALRTGEADGALLGPDAPAAEIALLRDDGRFAVRDLNGKSEMVIFLDTRSPLFDEAAVRKALRRGVNVATLLNDVAGGRGLPAGTGIPRASWAHTAIEVPTFDPGAAASALERAGWARGRDGVRRKGEQRLAFTLSTSNDPQQLAIAENVALQWQAIGASVRVEPFDSATYIEQYLLPRKFEAALVEIDAGPDPDPYPFWHTSQIAEPGRNLSSYSNPRVDDALERARQTTDTQRRKELYQTFSEELIEDTPALLLFTPVQSYVMRTSVQGFEPSLLFTPASRFANVHEWYVRTRVE